MSGLEHMRARLAECEALIKLLWGDEQDRVPVALVVRAAAWRDAIEAVAGDYAAAEEEEAAGEDEGDSLDADEPEETEAEADEDAGLEDAADNDAVVAPPSAIRRWAERHGVRVNSMGMISSHQLAAINAERAAQDLLPFAVKRS